LTVVTLTLQYSTLDVYKRLHVLMRKDDKVVVVDNITDGVEMMKNVGAPTRPHVPAGTFSRTKRH